MRAGFCSLKAEHASVANLINSDLNNRGGASPSQGSAHGKCIVTIGSPYCLGPYQLKSAHTHADPTHLSMYVMPGTPRWLVLLPNFPSQLETAATRLTPAQPCNDQFTGEAEGIAISIVKIPAPLPHRGKPNVRTGGHRAAPPQGHEDAKTLLPTLTPPPGERSAYM